MRAKWGFAAGILVVGMAGCELVLGIDKDYHPQVGASSSSSGEPCQPGPLGDLGTPCCEAGALSCEDHANPSQLICDPDGTWRPNGTCNNNTLCDTTAGLTQGTCKPILVGCAGKGAQDRVCTDKSTASNCGPDLVGGDMVEACPFVCIDGGCTGECKPDAKRCSHGVAQSCDGKGQWAPVKACSADAEICVAGDCVAEPKSCEGLLSTCGPNGDESCCQTELAPGGTYNRSNELASPATVSDFLLDKFEITVGRFRAFVSAYPSSKPTGGAGGHPKIAGSGWDAAWDANLPADQAALKAAVKCSVSYQTWTDAAMGNENLPMNCITWFEAFAFCAWDGGRLPTEAEWNYAAAGGGGADGQREYPWSTPPSSTTIDGSYAVYECSGDGSAANACAFTDILKVGSKSTKGDGKWGQADLSGSMWEWVLDWYADPYATPCNDCANLTGASGRVIRGGSWGSNASYLLSSVRDSGGPSDRSNYVGARCARTP